MRCPHCGCLETKRNGKTRGGPVGLSGPPRPLQRFWCGGCQRTFTTARKVARTGAQFADDVVVEAVRLYVQGLPSYRRLAELVEHRLGRSVSPITLNRWVDEAGRVAKPPLEVSAELAPSGWGGVLGIDGTVIRVRGRKHALLVGVDHPSQDIVHALVADHEHGRAFEQLVREAVTVAGYPLQGLVSDLGAGFAAAWRDHFSRVPFQACRIHYDRHLDQYIRTSAGSPTAGLRAEFKARLREILYAHSYEHARALLHQLIDERDRYANLAHPDPLTALAAKFDLYMAHHHHPQLPADNNIAENVIKQLGKKLGLMEGFGSLESADRFCRLLIACYRFKRFTDSRRNGGNGHSPLEHAGAQLPAIDWLHYLLTPPKQQHSM